jgi:hypothetical protein
MKYIFILLISISYLLSFNKTLFDKNTEVNIHTLSPLTIGYNKFILKIDSEIEINKVIIRALKNGLPPKKDKPGIPPQMEHMLLQKNNNGTYSGNLNFKLNGHWTFKINILFKDNSQKTLTTTLEL